MSIGSIKIKNYTIRFVWSSLNPIFKQCFCIKASWTNRDKSSKIRSLIIWIILPGIYKLCSGICCAGNEGLQAWQKNHTQIPNYVLLLVQLSEKWINNYSEPFFGEILEISTMNVTFRHCWRRRNGGELGNNFVLVHIIFFKKFVGLSYMS